MRRFKKFLLWFVVPLTAILVILGVFARQWLVIYLSPPQTFNASDVPAAPNYSKDYFWVAHPNKTDTSDLIPIGLDTSDDGVLQNVDVFFVHSTGYVGPGGWNSTMQKENSEAQSIEYMLSSMASIFNGCCRVYAPHYREAHLQAFLPEQFTLGTKALDLAFQDVEDAFDYYLKHFNQGRPFIIVSHSQGSAHALRLLETKVDNTELYQQFVAGYVLGYWLPIDKFNRGFQRIRPCTEPTQTQCIVSYDVFGQGGSLDANVPHWYKTGWELSQLNDGSTKNTLCVNPLSWNTALDKIDKSAHLGAMPVEFKRTPLYMVLATNPGFIFTELPKLTSELTWAQCKPDGRLEVMEQTNNPFSNHLSQANKSYHLLDFSLFYGNIRQNAKQRANQFIQTQHVSQSQ